MQDSSCRSLNIFAFDVGTIWGLRVPTSCSTDMGLRACIYPSIRKQENTSKEIILYSINKQGIYALVHKNATIELKG